MSNGKVFVCFEAHAHALSCKSAIIHQHTEVWISHAIVKSEHVEQVSRAMQVQFFSLLSSLARTRLIDV